MSFDSFTERGNDCSMTDPRVAELHARKVTPELYHEIRRLWQIHSIAEDRRDIPGLMSTLTDDCVYELVQTGHRWEGKEGAARFYSEMLAAFPDIHFELQNIIIGPQGVFEEAHATGTHVGPWLNFRPPSGKKIEFSVLILFPWDMEKRKFAGERIWFLLDGVL
jgi:predicted ester cyclase